MAFASDGNPFRIIGAPFQTLDVLRQGIPLPLLHRMSLMRK